MNLENQLQVALATSAELKEQIGSLKQVNWSQEVRLRHNAESREEMRAFYENHMENLRKEQCEVLERLQEQHRTQIEEAVYRITKSFEEQISKLIAERDAAFLAVKH